jgi:hypothetical protein
MRVQVIHHQGNAFGIRKIFLYQSPHTLRPLQGGVIVRHIYPSPTYKRGRKLNQMGDTVTLILNIITCNLTWLARQARSHFLHTLHTGLIHADHRIILIKRPSLKHRTDRLGITRMLHNKEVQRMWNQVATHQFPMLQAEGALKITTSHKCGKSCFIRTTTNHYGGNRSE